MRRTAVAAAVVAGALAADSAQAGGIFEVVHPEVRKGGFELEALSTVALGDVAGDDARSVHELALSYGATSFWKTIVAVEIANLEDDGVEVEALEFGNLLMLPFGESDHDHGHGHGGGYAIGLFQGLEIPREGGIGEGALALGPVAEAEVGGFLGIVNLFLEIPFAEGADPGVAYAVQVRREVGYGLSLGAEAHGGVEEAFGSAPGLDDQQHLAGPAIYAELDLGNRRVLEPRAAVLFGLTEASADAALSVNFELKF